MYYNKYSFGQIFIYDEAWFHYRQGIEKASTLQERTKLFSAMVPFLFSNICGILFSFKFFFSFSFFWFFVFVFYLFFPVCFLFLFHFVFQQPLFVREDWKTYEWRLKIAVDYVGKIFPPALRAMGFSIHSFIFLDGIIYSSSL